MRKRKRMFSIRNTKLIKEELMSGEFNQDNYYTENYKKIMLGLGLFVALACAYVTFLYFEYRVVKALWETVFISPVHFWEQVPSWEWKSVFN